MADQLEDILAEDFKFEDIKVGDIVWVNCGALTDRYSSRLPCPPVGLEVLAVCPEYQQFVVNVGESGWVPNVHLGGSTEPFVQDIMSQLSKENKAKHCAWYVTMVDITMLTKKIATNIIQAQSAGESCAKCKTFSPYSVPNMPDGKFVCYSCRSIGVISK